jgi:DNA polymerase-3 subunit beta
MEFSISQSDLSYALQTALASVPSKSTLPILQALLLELDEGQLRITGTDLEVTTSITVPCTAKSGGRAAVQARHFADAVRKLPKGEVRVAEEDGRVTVFYGNGKGKSQVPKLDDQDFPSQPEVRPEGSISLDGAVLSRLVGRTAYAVSSDETRPVLNGVLVEATGEEITLVATDGHRLARSRRKGSFGALSEDSFVIPGKTIQTVGRLASDATSEVEIGLSPARNQAAFRTKVGQYDIVVYSRLLEGPYPNVDQVIPKSQPRSLVVLRSDIRDAIDRVSTHSDNITHQVRFELDKKQVVLRVNTADVGAGEETIDGEYDGEPMVVGYNANYLLDILKSLDSEKVVFRLDKPTSAGVVEPEGGLPDKEEDLLCLIMPLRLPDAPEVAEVGAAKE